MNSEEMEDQAWEAFSSRWRKKAVSSTRTSKFDDGPGAYFVMGVNTKRTFSESEEGAKVHAHNIIDRGDCDEMLIVKVVGHIYRKMTPVEYESFED